MQYFYIQQKKKYALAYAFLLQQILVFKQGSLESEGGGSGKGAEIFIQFYYGDFSGRWIREWRKEQGLQWEGVGERKQRKVSIIERKKRNLLGTICEERQEESKRDGKEN